MSACSVLEVSAYSSGDGGVSDETWARASFVELALDAVIESIVSQRQRDGVAISIRVSQWT